MAFLTHWPQGVRLGRFYSVYKWQTILLLNWGHPRVFWGVIGLIARYKVSVPQNEELGTCVGLHRFCCCKFSCDLLHSVVSQHIHTLQKNYVAFISQLHKLINVRLQEYLTHWQDDIMDQCRWNTSFWSKGKRRDRDWFLRWESKCKCNSREPHSRDQNADLRKQEEETSTNIFATCRGECVQSILF